MSEWRLWCVVIVHALVGIDRIAGIDIVAHRGEIDSPYGFGGFARFSAIFLMKTARSTYTAFLSQHEAASRAIPTRYCVHYWFVQGKHLNLMSSWYLVVLRHTLCSIGSSPGNTAKFSSIRTYSSTWSAFLPALMSACCMMDFTVEELSPCTVMGVSSL